MKEVCRRQVRHNGYLLSALNLFGESELNVELPTSLEVNQKADLQEFLGYIIGANVPDLNKPVLTQNYELRLFIMRPAVDHSKNWNSFMTMLRKTFSVGISMLGNCGSLFFIPVSFRESCESCSVFPPIPEEVGSVSPDCIAYGILKTRRSNLQIKSEPNTSLQDSDITEENEQTVHIKQEKNVDEPSALEVAGKPKKSKKSSKQSDRPRSSLGYVEINLPIGAPGPATQVKTEKDRAADNEESKSGGKVRIKKEKKERTCSTSTEEDSTNTSSSSTSCESSSESEQPTRKKQRHHLGKSHVSKHVLVETKLKSPPRSSKTTVSKVKAKQHVVSAANKTETISQLSQLYILQKALSGTLELDQPARVHIVNRLIENCEKNLASIVTSESSDSESETESIKPRKNLKSKRKERSELPVKPIEFSPITVEDLEMCFESEDSSSDSDAVQILSDTPAPEPAVTKSGPEEGAKKKKKQKKEVEKVKEPVNDADTKKKKKKKNKVEDFSVENMKNVESKKKKRKSIDDTTQSDTKKKSKNNIKLPTTNEKDEDKTTKKKKKKMKQEETVAQSKADNKSDVKTSKKKSMKVQKSEDFSENQQSDATEISETTGKKRKKGKQIKTDTPAVDDKKPTKKKNKVKDEKAKETCKTSNSNSKKSAVKTDEVKKLKKKKKHSVSDSIEETSQHEASKSPPTNNCSLTTLLPALSQASLASLPSNPLTSVHDPGTRHVAGDVPAPLLIEPRPLDDILSTHSAIIQSRLRDSMSSSSVAPSPFLDASALHGVSTNTTGSVVNSPTATDDVPLPCKTFTLDLEITQYHPPTRDWPQVKEEKDNTSDKSVIEKSETVGSSKSCAGAEGVKSPKPVENVAPSHHNRGRGGRRISRWDQSDRQSDHGPSPPPESRSRSQSFGGRGAPRGRGHRGAHHHHFSRGPYGPSQGDFLQDSSQGPFPFGRGHSHQALLPLPGYMPFGQQARSNHFDLGAQIDRSHLQPNHLRNTLNQKPNYSSEANRIINWEQMDLSSALGDNNNRGRWAGMKGGKVRGRGKGWGYTK